MSVVGTDIKHGEFPLQKLLNLNIVDGQRVALPETESSN